MDDADFSLLQYFRNSIGWASARLMYSIRSDCLCSIRNT